MTSVSATFKKCSIPDCDSPAKSRGWCQAHYKKWKKYGSPTAGRFKKKKIPHSFCSVPNCEKTVHANGLCVAHYNRQRRNNSLQIGRAYPGELLEWLHAHVNYDSPECLIWPYSTARGYGILTVDGRQRVASNLMCELVHGAAPTIDHECAHSCGNGNKGCVNPSHLRWATRSENMMDKHSHGTAPIGTNNHASRLTAEDVRKIRDMKKSGESPNKIAKIFSISRGHVHDIANRKAWAHLP